MKVKTQKIQLDDHLATAYFNIVKLLHQKFYKMMLNIFQKKHFKKLIFEKKHFKKRITLYFSFEQKLEIYGLQYIGGYVILQLYKKLRTAKAKSRAKQFILSKRSFRQSEVLTNVKIRRQIQNYQEEVCDLFQSFYRKY